MLPSQWRDTYGEVGQRHPEHLLKWALLQEAHFTLVRMAPRVRDGSTRALTRLVNLMAWVEDPDGERAARAGIPYPYTFRDVCETVFPAVEAEAVARKFRELFRALRGTETLQLVQKHRVKRWQPAA